VRSFLQKDSSQLLLTAMSDDPICVCQQKVYSAHACDMLPMGCKEDGQYYNKTQKDQSNPGVFHGDHEDLLSLKEESATKDN
jgi:hypothetical protein